MTNKELIEQLIQYPMDYSKYPNGEMVDPWNYPSDALITLCSQCHKKEHLRKKPKWYFRKYDF